MPRLDSKIRPGDVVPKRDIDPAFGNRVRSARKELGINLSDLAERVGISTAYLSQIERAIFPPPRAEIIVSLANELRQNPSELLSLAGMTDLTVVELFRRNPDLIKELQEAFATLPDHTRKALLPVISEQMLLDILKITLRGNRPTQEQWEGLQKLVFGVDQTASGKPHQDPQAEEPSTATPPRKPRRKP
ncbi:MAG: helix-turn-helix transcriptional regulator [Methanothrix sp.]|nr:helix-turn-helix transcriptional regulator [Methanothrix sp.]